MIRTADGELTRSLPLPPTLHTSSGTLAWVAEDTILAYGVEEGREGIYRMDPRDGTFDRLPSSSDRAGNVKFFEAAPDGRTVYVLRGATEASDASELVARDTATGEQRVIASARTGVHTLAVSPDGQELAYITLASDGVLELRAVPTSGSGATRTVYRAAPGLRMRQPVAWAPDGGSLLFGAVGEGEAFSVWSVAAVGGSKAVPVAGLDRCVPVNDLRVSPDGRRAVCVAGPSRGAVWMLTGF